MKEFQKNKKAQLIQVLAEEWKTKFVSEGMRFRKHKFRLENKEFVPEERNLGWTEEFCNDRDLDLKWYSVSEDWICARMSTTAKEYLKPTEVKRELLPALEFLFRLDGACHV
jgi:hypothetical protein